MMMTREQTAREYYRLAYQCEELKAKGCAGLCAKCPLYLPNYTSFHTEDQQEMVLIQTTAAIDYKQVAALNKDRATREVITTIVCIALLVWGVLSFRSCITPDQKPIPVGVEETTTTTLVQSTEIDWDNYFPPTHVLNTPSDSITRNHLAIIRRVHANIHDINNDGLINCIDYAVLFYMYYGPDSRIIQNKNEGSGMNHLFNAIPGAGGWVYIEPQADPNGPTRMEDNWGRPRYLPSYNRDVTETYKQRIGIRWQ